ncbi:MAG TPA: hypothetical protein PL048_04325 [Leptospiraceae bacterium]|nr:hypothetical protein [Leptospiraceae bacterium]HMZ57974.1 hypothetical protein [Leptospiraceae bacterium]HNF16436.1 hypothetical protein [Leptospiraceae bacterium]HNF25856.1 hypothetical protein [Leptospiraceae bacterium]HNI26497.1 hypothetical protein [Leptospiraceae bacterium]
MFLRLKLPTIVFFVLFPAVLLSETIMLRNGTSIKGKVLGHDSESVTIQSDGVTKTIPKSSIYKVIFSQGNSELKKFLIEKKGLDSKHEDDLKDFDDNSADKKELAQKLNQLEKKIDKMEKRLGKLKDRMTKLRAKIKQKEQEEKKG